MNSSEAMPTPLSGRPKSSPLDWVREVGKADAVLQDIEKKLLRRKLRRIKAAGVAGGMVAVAALLIWAVPLARHTNSINTPAAHRQTLALEDGSTAELNAQTTVRTDFRYGRRAVELERGEAFFSVAKDPDHPFLVVTPAGTISVTGTEFNVRLANRGTAEVTLIEGAVSIEQPTGVSVGLQPRQQFSTGGALRTLAADEIANVTAWRQGRLVLDGLTLAEAAARIAAYHGRTIEVDAKVASFRMGGSCPLDDLPGFLEFLPNALSVSVLSHGDGSYRIVAR
jgi:transmembrane sensor